MTIELRPATESDVRTFAAWNYDPPYDVYDIVLSVADAVVYFQEPDVHCYTLLEKNAIVGYCTFGHDARVPGGNYDGDGLDIGLGIEPSRTGSSKGRRYVTAVVAHALATFGPQRLRVSIAVANKRALRVWSGAGFTEVSRFLTAREQSEPAEFVILAHEPIKTART
ncbi:MAG: GNAT family N-acetyltransferase [Actinomycetota bacterium]|nr:GNAT family N-acetyltransferase [Actinomycetota bacterium]